mmetsp:Transcript_86113/g.229813  ORF Transcript_86113/g.229813 Transcript_86113/m.229813 type:complete len:461 (-) Transcript_86113:40-1422(-)
MTAAAACDCTRGLPTSSMTCTSAGSTTSCCVFWRSGPRSVSSWPTALMAAHRTRGCWSAKQAVICRTTSPRWSSIWRLQPSAICERQQRAAWRYFQSGWARKEGTRSGRSAWAKMVFPPSERARRSRQSLPTSRLVISLSSSSSVVLFHWARSISSTSTMSLSASGTMLATKACCLRIMAGACSDSVRSISTARKRVSLSSCSADDTVKHMCTSGSMLRRKNLGASSATEMRSSMADRADSSSCSLSAPLTTPKSAGMSTCSACSWSSRLDSAWIRHEEALSAASRTSLLCGSCSVAWNSEHSVAMCGINLSLTEKVRRDRTSIALSRISADSDFPAPKTKARSSGHSPCPIIVAPTSPVVSAILRRIFWVFSCWIAEIKVDLTAACEAGDNCSRKFFETRLRNITADIALTVSSSHCVMDTQMSGKIASGLVQSCSKEASAAFLVSLEGEVNDLISSAN